VPELRLLRPGDDAALHAFLAAHADTSMFLRGNARSAGLIDHGGPMEATYAASIEGGSITRWGGAPPRESRRRPGAA